MPNRNANVSPSIVSDKYFDKFPDHARSPDRAPLHARPDDRHLRRLRATLNNAHMNVRELDCIERQVNAFRRSCCERVLPTFRNPMIGRPDARRVRMDDAFFEPKRSARTHTVKMPSLMVLISLVPYFCRRPREDHAFHAITRPIAAMPPSR